MENTCKTCINNDDGLCDRKGILIEDEDHCDQYKEKPKLKKHEKKLDVTAELMVCAVNTLIQCCGEMSDGEDGTCIRCSLYQHCPGILSGLPKDWPVIRYPYLKGNTICFVKNGKVQQKSFASHEEAERHFEKMKEGIR